jgi:UDP-glucose 4-epimerase
MAHPNDRYLDAYPGRTVVITGGLGFIGSNLAHALAGLDDVRLVVLDSLVPDLGGHPFNLDGIAGPVAVHRVAIGDTEAVTPLLSGADLIFNLAGSVSHIDSMKQPLLDLELNASDHLAFLEACRRACPGARIVFSSTRQVYGRPDYLPVDEEHPARPVDVNGVHKLAAEQYHQIYHHVHGLPSVILRLTNTFGPRQLVRHARQGFIGWFVRQAIDGEEIKIYGDGTQVRDMNYVDDVVEALLRAGAAEEACGRILNLGGPQPALLIDIARSLVRVAGSGSVSLIPWPPEKRAIDIGDCYCDYRRAMQVLGWRPRTDLATGLRGMVEFYRRHREQYWSPVPAPAAPAAPLPAREETWKR